MVARSKKKNEEFGYLAVSALNTGYEPKKFDKNASVDEKATFINDLVPQEISDFSKTTNENARQLFTQCLNPLFRTLLICW